MSHEFLLKLQWWNWSEEEIFNNLEMLTSEAGLEQLMDKKQSGNMSRDNF